MENFSLNFLIILSILLVILWIWNDLKLRKYRSEIFDILLMKCHAKAVNDVMYIQRSEIKYWHRIGMPATEAAENLRKAYIGQRAGDSHE